MISLKITLVSLKQYHAVIEVVYKDFRGFGNH
jgi:hypothetical protein